jgi:triphosphoribosyl-dephospho-CoA synthase
MTLAEQIELACLIEATARKAGNVHPAAAFHDLDYSDFVAAARAVAEPLAQARDIGLGRAILAGIKATRAAKVWSNANLGIVLLLAPLAAVPAEVSLRDGVRDVLGQTTIEDAELVYEAIRFAKPGGMGKAASQDVSESPCVTLRDAMAFAAGRDRIAEQYVTDFAFVLDKATNWLHEDWTWLGLCPLSIFGRTGMRNEVSVAPWEAVVKKLHLRIMADAPDSLVVRKCGLEVGEQVRQRAAELVDLDWPQSLASWSRFDDFDLWLRSDGHRLNPGTSADLVAAVLFAALRDGAIHFPTRDRILSHAEQLLSTPTGALPDSN